MGLRTKTCLRAQPPILGPQPQGPHAVPAFKALERGDSTRSQLAAGHSLQLSWGPGGHCLVP